MESRPSIKAPARATELVAWYLDPTRSWNQDLDAEMRALVRADDAARALYDQAVVTHRLAVGADPEEQSGFERERMMAAVLDQALGVETSQGWLAWLTSAPTMRWMGTAAAVALVLVVVRPWAPSDTHDDLRARGGDAAEVLVGFGISGVDAQGQEYEVVASGQLSMDDHIRVTYTNEDPRLGHLFILGLQENQPLIWYAPLPPEETSSVAIERGKGALPFEILVGARHREGPAKVVAIFTAEPVSTQQVERALDSGLATMGPEDLEVEIARRLGCQEGDRVRVLQTRIQVGSGVEGRP
ncbi:MAG: hypothetical protein VX938_05010 [Myxococcota bacterium]|nr:hypothetical protein [Myxococcota bacterium]